MLPDAMPGQAIERNAYLLLTPAPEVSITPQAAIMPASNVTRDYHAVHQRATGAESVVAGDVHPPAAIPTTSLVRTFHTPPLLGIFSCHNTVVSVPPLGRDPSSQLDQDSTKEL